MELWGAAKRLESMKRLIELFLPKRKAQPPEPARPADFFCIYCNAKFPHDELDRVVAHLKPHRTKDEAEARLHAAG